MRCAAAANAVQGSAGLLRTRASTLTESMPALVEVLGEAGARDAVAKHKYLVITLAQSGTLCGTPHLGSRVNSGPRYNRGFDSGKPLC